MMSLTPQGKSLIVLVIDLIPTSAIVKCEYPVFKQNTCTKPGE
jgi:hypothetical protein